VLPRVPYFAPPEDAEQVTFSADLVDAATAQRLGAIEIPFHVE